MQGNYYEWTFYVLNNGAQQVYLSYLPTTYSADGGQTKITINVNAIQYGVPCEMADNHLNPPLSSNALPYALPEKNVAVPTNGFLLMPTKMVKLDVILYVSSIVEGVTETIPFEIAGVNVQAQV